MNPLFCEASVYIFIHRFLDSETFPPLILLKLQKMCRCPKTCGPNCTCTGRDECSPYLRIWIWKCEKVPENRHTTKYKLLQTQKQICFTKERKAGVESYVPSSLSKEPLFETKLD